MRQFLFSALLGAACGLVAFSGVSADEHTGSVFLEILRSPPNRHVIAMSSMEECLRAAEFSKAKCVTKQPRLPDSSIGVMRTTDWSARPFINVSAPLLKGKDFGPAYLVISRSPPNRHVIAMDSMKKCLEAASYTSAECIEELPNLPDSSVGVLRTLNSSNNQP
ncbi:MAG: hypothetical protein H8E36_01775 [Rhodospirillaceae bacterium]|nr:hypothetical protein [Rhodospirillaceae bacterium]MBL6941282.1 hypothetical protein [Rhodospirillales bacterium]